MSAPRWLLQGLVAGWCVLLVSLSVRTHITHDDRYGLAMFSRQITYQLRYSWIDETGRRWHHRPRDLRGGAWRLRVTPGKKHRESILGEGAMAAMIRGYLQWVWENEPAEGAVAITAKLTWQEFGQGPTHTINLSHP